MKNYVQEGENLSVPAPYAVAPGDGVLVGFLFGFAQIAAAIGALVPIMTWGVVDAKKTAGNTFAIGDLVYWDNNARSLTSTAAGNRRVGVAFRAALAGHATLRVRLDRAPP